jgi:catechol 2,3-dioxygenase-like lactoylglutathione lyase family enzyme
MRLIVIVAAALVTAGAGQTPPERPRVTGISHVALRASDPAGTRAFYSVLLGLDGATISGTGRYAYAVGSRQRIVIEPGLSPQDDERLLHLAFETPDIAAMTAYLTARGLQPQRSDDCQAGAVRVSDPDGHTIELVPVRWPPAAGQAPSAGSGRARSASSGQAPERALSGRILHAGLTIRDEAAAHRFYGDVLGFSEIWRGGRKEGVTQWVNMRVPDGTDYLEYMLVTSAPDRRQRGVLHHLCLVVPDIQSAYEETARRTPEAARAQLGRPQVGVNGRWQLNLYDPDGTRVELMEPFRVR